MSAVVLPCTRCGKPAVIRIEIRGCAHLRCDPCGAQLLARLPIIEPDYPPVVERIAEVIAA